MHRAGLLLAAIVLFFGVAAAWVPILDAGVFWDDRGTLAQGVWLDGPWAGFWPQAFAPHLGHWQPLTWLSLRLDEPLWGGVFEDLLGDDRPNRAIGPHLLGNLLLHASSAVLLFALALRALRLAPQTAALPLWAHGMAAGWAAAVWALHPARVESVAWMTERRDGLSTFFVLLGLLVWLGARAAGDAASRDENTERAAQSRPQVRWTFALAALCFAASALAKAWVLALPGALLGLEIAVFAALSRPGGLVAALRRSAAWLALSLPVAALAAWAQSAAGAAAGVGGLSLPERIVGALAALPRYASLTLWPATLSPLHPIVPGQTFAPLSIAMAVGSIVAGVWLWRARARVPGLVGAAIGALAWLAPVLGLLQSGVQSIAERYLILAHVPLALGASALLAVGLGSGITPLPNGRWIPGRLTLPTMVGASVLIGPLLVRLFLWQGRVGRGRGSAVDGGDRRGAAFAARAGEPGVDAAAARSVR